MAAFLPIAKTIFKSLFHKPATQKYPFAPMPKDPLVRGQIQIDIDDCIFCGMCVRKCPTHALAVERAEKSWEIHRFQCIVCGGCVEVCPKKCLHMKPELTPANDTKDANKFVAAEKPAAVKPADTKAGATGEAVKTGEAREGRA